MIGTILTKPVDAEAFRTAMAFCCDPKNGARMMEYSDRYEVQERPEEPAPVEEPVAEEITPEQRFDEIETALCELAALIVGEE